MLASGFGGQILQEKRRYARTPIDEPVTFRGADGASATGVAKDIAVGGMFIESASLPAYGATLTITVTIPGDPDAQARDLPATVRWERPGGFGVQFGPLGARETHLITEVARRAESA